MPVVRTACVLPACWRFVLPACMLEFCTACMHLLMCCMRCCAPCGHAHHPHSSGAPCFLLIPTSAHQCCKAGDLSFVLLFQIGAAEPSCSACCHTVRLSRFYFAVWGMQPGVPYKFNLVNFRKKLSLFGCGKMPLVCRAVRPSPAAGAASSRFSNMLSFTLSFH